MNKTALKYAALVLTLALLSGGWWIGRKSSSRALASVSPERNSERAPAAQVNSAAVSARPTSKATPASPAPSTSASPSSQLPSAPRAAMRDQDSLDALTATLARVGQPPFPVRNLVEQLQRTGQQPLVVRDANPDSGEMVIVRTQSPLPGTRYFHAQYFTDESGERFVQHMSFEFKPGPDAMAAAVATVERIFSNLPRPKVKRDDFVEWSLNERYIVWVKKMSPEDLQEDPFNAYTIADNGTIRVAVELEIHGD